MTATAPPAVLTTPSPTTSTTSLSLLSTTTPSAFSLSLTSNPTALVNKPTFIEHDNYRFLIMDMPTDQNIHSYVEVLKKKNIVAVVRACEANYSSQPLTEANIQVVDVPYADGECPPPEVVQKWLNFIQPIFAEANDTNKVAIAVHCVAGLGRAPLLVAIALVEYGMESYDAVAFIRKKRRGAINSKQLAYIEAYVPKRSQSKGCCTIM